MHTYTCHTQTIERKFWKHKKEVTLYVTGNNIKINNWLLTRSKRGQRQWDDVFSAQRKETPLTTVHPAKVSFTNEAK